MNFNPVGRFEIYVTDMNRAKAFYEGVFQKWDWMDLSQEKIEMFAFPWGDKIPGAAWALVKMDDWGPSTTGWALVYFSCEDCAVEEARIVEHGGKVHQTKTDIGEFGFIAMVHDTEGNMIGLHSNK